MDYSLARFNMVESQLRTNKVTSLNLIEAMGKIPREKFVPKQISDLAYIDHDIMVAPGRYIMEPLVLARLLQEAPVKKQDVALDVGCATGYASAVLGQLAGTVVGLEEDSNLCDAAAELLNDIGADNVITVAGDIVSGYSRQSPYDVILLNGCIPFVPQTLTDQLAEGGRMVGVLCKFGDAIGRATIWLKLRGEISSRVICDASISYLPGFQSSASFKF